MALRTDVSNGKDVSSTFNSIMENYYTPPNIVVNAAGIIKDNFLLNLTEEDFDKVIDVNLKVQLFLMKINLFFFRTFINFVLFLGYFSSHADSLSAFS